MQGRSLDVVMRPDLPIAVLAPDKYFVNGDLFRLKEFVSWEVGEGSLETRFKIALDSLKVPMPSVTQGYLNPHGSAISMGNVQSSGYLRDITMIVAKLSFGLVSGS